MSRIKVDPRTFSIINQDKEIMPIAGSMSTSENTNSTDTSTDSESDAGNGFASESGSDPVIDQVKVIKLQSSEPLEQQGGRNKIEPSTYLKSNQQEIDRNRGLSSYLKPSIKNKFEDQISSKIKKKEEEYSNDDNDDNADNDNLTDSSEQVKSVISVETSEQNKPDISTETSSQNKSEVSAEVVKPVEIFKHSESEVIDLSGDKLYEVLAMVLEDQKGDNISENLFKLNKTMEKHSEIMEKILNQLISMQNKSLEQSSVSASIVIPKKLQENEGMAGGKTLERMKDRK